MCRILKLSRQAVYQRARRLHKQQFDEQVILERVRSLRRLMPRIGTRKLYHQLKGLGIGRDKFFELLRLHQMLIKPRKRFIATTNSRHGLPARANLLLLSQPDGPHQVLVADQTYLRLERGFCYLSLVSDLWSRKILGYDVSRTLETDGPLRALRMALVDHPTAGPILHHSDRGVQYCSDAYTQTLSRYDIRISNSAPGCPYDNAVAERINGILKSEFYLDGIFRSVSEAETAAGESVWVYNNFRPHLSLEMMTPNMKHAA